MSGYSEDTMIPWSAWMQYVLFNQQYDFPAVVDEQLKKAIEKQNKAQKCDSTNFNTPKTCYDIISTHPQLTRMKWLCDYVGYGKVKDLQFPITLFAPIDDKFDETLEYPLNYAFKPTACLQVLRYHILPFVIKPWQMEDRRLRLRTDLEKQPVESDWTNGKRQLLNPISKRKLPEPFGYGVNPIGDYIPSLPDVWFPKKYWEVDILDCIECAGGIVYVISRPIVFNDVL